MGRLIATTQATIDGVIDPVGEWVQPDGDHGDYSFERQARSSGLGARPQDLRGAGGILAEPDGQMGGHGQRDAEVRSVQHPVRRSQVERDPARGWTSRGSIPKLKDEVHGDLFMHGSGEFAYALAAKGLIDEYEVYLNPLVWGEGNVHVLGDRGTVRMELDDVKRFDSGVVLLTYRPAS